MSAASNASDAKPRQLDTHEAFNDPQRYLSMRPGYTSVCLQYVHDLVDGGQERVSGSTLDVVEVGAGPGNFTRVFLPYLADNPRYLATDVSQQFMGDFAKELPNVPTAVCEAANLSMCADNSVETIIAATAFHWFATEEALSEFRRVLVPGGVFVCFWNQFTNDQDWEKPLALDLAKIFDAAKAPYESSDEWLRVAMASPGFVDKTERNLEGWNQSGNADWWRRYYHNVSAIISKPDAAEREAAVDQVCRHLPQKDDANFVVHRKRHSRIFHMRKDPMTADRC